MAGLGEAASFSGLINLAGQTVQAISALYTFYERYKTVDIQVEQIGKELGNLRNSLQQIEVLAADESTQTLQPTDAAATLSHHILECRDEIESWNRKLDSINLCGAQGAKRLLKKMKLSANREYLIGIRERLRFQREQLDLSLGLLGAHVGLHNIRYLEAAENGINALQAEQSILRDGTFCRLADLREDMRLLQTQQSDSFGTIHSALENLNESYGSSAGATKASLDNIDARLKEIQKQLQQSINRAHSAKRGKLPLKVFKRKVPFAARRLEIFGFRSSQVRQASDSIMPVPLRLVKLGILLQERNGRLEFDLIALEDVDYAAADFNQKVALVEHVIGLRLITWLLRTQNYLPNAEFCLRRRNLSRFALQASLVSEWQFGNFCSTLIGVLDGRADLGRNISWTRYKPWLQYLFGRIGDREQDAERIVEMVLRLWARFPVPEDKQPAFYYLKLPAQLCKEDVLRHLHTCTIFHFAGHGQSDPLESSQSCLLLEDWKTNPLTSEDLRDHRLQENPSFLGYLSACSTGANEADRLLNKGIHLVSAFQLAGFRHVVGTLWKVSDEHCVDVMKILYKTIRDKGMTNVAVCRGLYRGIRALRGGRIETVQETGNSCQQGRRTRLAIDSSTGHTCVYGFSRTPHHLDMTSRPLSPSFEAGST